MTSASSLLRGLLAALGFVFASGQIYAGTIIGRVSNSDTGAHVVGAAVTSVATGHVVYADSEGRFRFDNLAAGPVTLQVEALGFGATTQQVEVPASGAVSVDIALGADVVALDKLVVEGYREGRSRALQQKRNAPNLKDIVSNDSAGDLPDKNVAEALARLPGVALSVESGEGQFISIRGIEPSLNTVNLNGATMENPAIRGRTGRAMPFDILSTAQIGSVELIKALTPDMDGTSLGGTVNIKTPTGYDYQKRYIAGSVETGKNDDNRTKGTLSSADFVIADVFGKKRAFGAAFTAAYSKRPTGYDNIQAVWVGTPAQPYIGEFRVVPEYRVREKLSFTLNLDYRPDTNTEIYFRSLYNDYDETRDKDEQLYQQRSAPTFITPTSISIATARYDIRTFHFERERSMTDLALGGSRRFNNFKIETELTYARAQDDQPVFDTAQFRTGNVAVPGGFILDFTDKYPTFDDKGTVAAANPEIRRFRQDTILTNGESYTWRLDVQRDFNSWFGGKDGFLKFGVKYTDRDRLVDGTAIWNTGPFALRTFAPTLPGYKFFDGRYMLPVGLDYPKIWAFGLDKLKSGQLTPLVEDMLSNGSEDDYVINEKISALYGMTSVNVNSKLTVLGGLRYERTDATMDSKQFRTVGGVSTLFPTRGEFEYDQFLPNLQFRYAITKETLLRAAITNTFGRPAFEAAAPRSTLNVDNGALTIGNPELQPYEAANFDLSLEHYLKSGGVLSVALFHKEIDNPIYAFSEVRTNVTQDGIFFPVLTVSSQRNAEKAKISGVELNVQLPFSSFTSGPLDGFGVDLNATFSESEVTVFSRPNEELPFFQQPDTLYNAALYYQKNRLTMRAAYNFRSESLDSVGGTDFSDAYSSERFFWDLQASYKVHENFTVYLSWQNVTNEPVETYTGASNRLASSTLFGSNLRAGVKFRF